MHTVPICTDDGALLNPVWHVCSAGWRTGRRTDAVGGHDGRIVVGTGLFHWYVREVAPWQRRRAISHALRASTSGTESRAPTTNPCGLHRTRPEGCGRRSATSRAGIRASLLSNLSTKVVRVKRRVRSGNRTSILVEPWKLRSPDGLSISLRGMRVLASLSMHDKELPGALPGACCLGQRRLPLCFFCGGSWS